MLDSWCDEKGGKPYFKIEYNIKRAFSTTSYYNFPNKLSIQINTNERIVVCGFN